MIDASRAEDASFEMREMSTAMTQMARTCDVEMKKARAAIRWKAAASLNQTTSGKPRQIIERNYAIPRKYGVQLHHSAPRENANSTRAF